MRLTLRPYQSDALARVEARLGEGVRRQLGVAATGLGKTAILIALAERMGVRTLILAHRDELIQQAVAEILSMWPDVPSLGIVKGPENHVGAHVVVGSVQTLSRADRLARLCPCYDPTGPAAPGWGPAPFGLVIVDECFPAGTMVGGRPIETLRPGDLVPSWDEKTGAPCLRPVVNTQRRQPAGLVTVTFDDGEQVTCTPNHPLMTTRGWSPAGTLSRGDYLLSFTRHAAADRDDVHRVPSTGDDHRQTETGQLQEVGPDVLLAGLPRSMGVPEQFRAHGSHQQEARLGPDEGAQSDATSRGRGEDASVVDQGWPPAKGTGRERPRSDRRPSSLSGSAGLADRGRHPDRAETQGGTAVALQDRHREPRGEGGYRDRWVVPFLAGAPRVRSTQGRVAQWRRVVGVEVHERGSDGRYDGRCKDGAVYNLEVAGTHTYLVGSGVVAHNCHHAAADSYRRILTHVGAGKPDGPFLYGTTATPKRGDGKGLDDVFDEITFTYDMLWGIRSGYLADVRGLRVKVDGLDVSKVKTSRGDYQAGDSGRALEEAGAPWAIAQAITDHARDRLTLAFLPTVATAEATRDACRALGLRAECVSDSTPTDVRRGILAAYKRHDIDVVTNCMVLTEGFNAPRTDCVAVGRLTKSQGLYVQMVGRGTRKHPDKTDCLVLDVVGNSDRHSLVTVASLFGLPDRYQDRTHDGSATVSELVGEYEEAEMRAGRLRAEAVELFRKVRREGLAWVQVPRPGDDRTYYVLKIAADVRVVMRPADPDDDQSWAVQVQHPDGNATLISGTDLETCQGTGEDYARANGDHRLLDTKAGWRKGPPKPRQLTAAENWHLPNIDQYKTAGDLSDALTAHIEAIHVRRRNRRAKTPTP